MFTHGLVTAFVALPFFAQFALAAECSRSYTVKEGDICDSISASQNVSTYQLSAVNPGIINEDCSNLVAGKTLCIGYTGEDCTATYVVRALDTCDIVAAKHGLNSTILNLNNPQISSECDNLYIGEVLCVENSVHVPPAPAGQDIPGARIPETATPASLQSTVVTSGVPTPHVQIPTPTDVNIPAVTSITTHINTPPATTTPEPAPEPETDGLDDGDDENLPWCDEI